MPEELKQHLWRIADTLRGKMDADDFRDYILGFIFYKYLSEKMHAYADNVLKPDKITYVDIDESTKAGKEYLYAIRAEALDALGYFLKPSELFGALASRTNAEGKAHFILDDLSKILNNIQQSTLGTASKDEFSNLFEDLDLTSSKLGKTEREKNELVVRIMQHLDQVDFDLDNPENDILGDAYEYLIGKFASGAGKKAGEFYTPQQVSMVLARLVTVGKTKLKNVYDPTCGSGSLLLRVAREVKEVGKIYGQESNPTTYNLCRMNMIMHNVHYNKFDIKNDDTLERPQHQDLRFDAIVANPPFSAEWSASPLFMSDDRYAPYGRLAPKGTADFAFVQHMIHQLADGGTMACVLPHGVLFRGGAEGHIREYIIKEKNYLDAVIGLPSNIFYGTSIPTCILVLKKDRYKDAERSRSVLFIDASQHFEKVKTQNVLRPEDIDKIIDTYKKRNTEDKYSYVAALGEIKENDYNLSISRYVNTFDDEKKVNIEVVSDLLRQVNEQSIGIDKKIKEFCNELSIPVPIGSNLFLLKEYKKGVMQQLFSGKLRFKDDNRKSYPKWEMRHLRDVSKIYDGTHQTPNYVSEGIPFYSVEHVTANDFSNTKYISVEVFEKENQRVNLEKGDILMTRIGDIGTARLIDWDVKASFYVSLALLKQSDIISSKYLNQYIASRNFQLELWKRTIHVAFPKKINLGEIGNCKVMLPIMEEQEKIANFLSAIDTKIESVAAQIEKAQTFKKGLLQQVFV